MDVAELRTLFLFDGLDDDQLRRLAAASEEVTFHAGEVLFHEGDQAGYLWVLLDGSVELVRQAGREEAVVKMMDRPGVWAGGFQAWEDSIGYLATGRGAGDGRMLRLPSTALGDLTREWFPFAVHLIEGFFQTVRRMDTLTRQRESLIALGQLAAGLAHEVNNPISAATRAVDALGTTHDELLGALVGLAERSLTAEQFVRLEGLRREIDGSNAPVGALETADREELLLEWLDAHDVDDGWRLAPRLAAAGVDVDWCERAAELLSSATLTPGLEWVAGTLTARSLLAETKEATTRVSQLVDAVKSYSQVGRASLQLVDLTEGIESTLVMLRHKLRDGITIERDFGAGVPEIEANPSELNQVWTNLVDNAVDAMEGKGTLRISTRVDGSDVVVEFGDTGPGMPPEVQSRAFEPFYTTKDVGKGTGLGLDISRRIIADRHHGHIAIESGPTGTRIVVRLPRPQDPDAAAD